MNKAAGFSLLDALLGLALLASGLMGILYVFQGSVSSSLVTDQSVVASNLARQTLEKISAQRDCNLSGCGFTATLASINAQAYDQSSVAGFPIYSISAVAYEVNPDANGVIDDFLDAQSGSGFMRVTVTVNWNNGANSNQLVTLLGSYEP